MSHTAIVAVTPEGRLAKRADFTKESDALAHVDKVSARFPDAFVIETPSEPETDWLIDMSSQTVVIRPPAATTAEVSEEAERRIAEGILVGGEPFRCDGESRQRLQEMIDRFESGETTRQTFRTAAGRQFTLTNAAQPKALAKAVGDYVAALLERSAELQADPPPDVADDRHWPPRPSIPSPT